MVGKGLSEGIPYGGASPPGPKRRDAASGYVPGLAWHAKIYINDVLKAEGDVGRFNRLRANFAV